MKPPAGHHLRALPPLSDDESPGRAPPGSEELLEPPAEGAVSRAKSQRTLLNQTGRGLLLVAISIVAASLVGPRLVGVELPVGAEFKDQIARVHVRADRDYVVVDRAATEALRAVRERASRSVWDLDLARAQADAHHVASAFTRVTEALRTQPLAVASKTDLAPQNAGVAQKSGDMQRSGERAAIEGDAPPVAQLLVEARARLAGDLALIGVEAPRDSVWDSLRVVLSGAPEARETLLGEIRDGLSRPVVEDRSLLGRDGQFGIVIRPVPSSLRQEERVLENVQILPDVATARRDFRKRLSEGLWNPAVGVSREHAQRVSEWASSLLRSTLTYNAAESQARRTAARESVPEKTVRIFRGEMVLHPGEVIGARHLLLLEAMERQQGEQLRARAALGSGGFVLLLCWLVYRFGVVGVFRRSLETRDLWVLGGLLNATLLMIYVADQAIVPLSEWMRALAFEVPPLAVVCVVPIAWGAMQVRLLMSAEIALLFAVLLALLGGVMAEPGTTWTLVSLVSSLAAIAMVERIQRRLGLLLCGLAAGAAAGITAATLELFRGAMNEEQLVVFMLAASVGGLLSGALSAIGSPLAETFLGYETRLRLISLADPNQPLLKDLLVHAPGTWKHSVRTATLAEAACLEIRADAALVRVMALYHDVGKIAYPHMFSENEEDSLRARDEMSEAEALQVYRGHVEEGRRMAKKARLPNAVVRAISSHHGHMPVGGARMPATIDSSAPTSWPLAVTPYDGPMPMSKESAVLVLADQLERALYEDGGRSALDSSQQVIAVVRQVQSTGTLGSSSLTFHDLERVCDAFVNTIPKLPQLTRRHRSRVLGTLAGEGDDVISD